MDPETITITVRKRITKRGMRTWVLYANDLSSAATVARRLLYCHCGIKRFNGVSRCTGCCCYNVWYRHQFDGDALRDILCRAGMSVVRAQPCQWAMHTDAGGWRIFGFTTSTWSEIEPDEERENQEDKEWREIAEEFEVTEEELAQVLYRNHPPVPM